MLWLYVLRGSGNLVFQLLGEVLSANVHKGWLYLLVEPYSSASERQFLSSQLIVRLEELADNQGSASPRFSLHRVILTDSEEDRLETYNKLEQLYNFFVHESFRASLPRNRLSFEEQIAVMTHEDRTTAGLILVNGDNVDYKRLTAPSSDTRVEQVRFPEMEGKGDFAAVKDGKFLYIKETFDVTKPSKTTRTIKGAVEEAINKARIEGTQGKSGTYTEPSARKVLLGNAGDDKLYISPDGDTSAYVSLKFAKPQKIERISIDYEPLSDNPRRYVSGIDSTYWVYRGSGVVALVMYQRITFYNGGNYVAHLTGSSHFRGHDDGMVTIDVPDWVQAADMIRIIPGYNTSKPIRLGPMNIRAADHTIEHEIEEGEVQLADSQLYAYWGGRKVKLVTYGEVKQLYGKGGQYTLFINNDEDLHWSGDDYDSVVTVMYTVSAAVLERKLSALAAGASEMNIRPSMTMIGLMRATPYGPSFDTEELPGGENGELIASLIRSKPDNHRVVIFQTDYNKQRGWYDSKKRHFIKIPKSVRDAGKGKNQYKYLGFYEASGSRVEYIFMDTTNKDLYVHKAGQPGWTTTKIVAPFKIKDANRASGGAIYAHTSTELIYRLDRDKHTGSYSRTWVGVNEYWHSNDDDSALKQALNAQKGSETAYADLISVARTLPGGETRRNNYYDTRNDRMLYAPTATAKYIGYSEGGSSYWIDHVTHRLYRVASAAASAASPQQQSQQVGRFSEMGFVGNGQLYVSDPDDATEQVLASGISGVTKLILKLDGKIVIGNDTTGENVIIGDDTTGENVISGKGTAGENGVVDTYSYDSAIKKLISGAKKLTAELGGNSGPSGESGVISGGTTGESGVISGGTTGENGAATTYSYNPTTGQLGLYDEVVLTRTSAAGCSAGDKMVIKLGGFSSEDLSYSQSTKLVTVKIEGHEGVIVADVNGGCSVEVRLSDGTVVFDDGQRTLVRDDDTGVDKDYNVQPFADWWNAGGSSGDISSNPLFQSYMAEHCPNSQADCFEHVVQASAGGDEGIKTVNGSSQSDLIIGSDSSDIINGGAGPNLIFSKGGADLVYANLGDFVDAGAGDDYVLVPGKKGDYSYETSENGNERSLVMTTEDGRKISLLNAETVYFTLDWSKHIYSSDSSSFEVESGNQLPHYTGSEPLDNWQITSGSWDETDGKFVGTADSGISVKTREEYLYQMPELAKKIRQGTGVVIKVSESHGYNNCDDGGQYNHQLDLRTNIEIQSSGGNAIDMFKQASTGMQSFVVGTDGRCVGGDWRHNNKAELRLPVYILSEGMEITRIEIEHKVENVSGDGRPFVTGTKLSFSYAQDRVPLTSNAIYFVKGTESDAQPQKKWLKNGLEKSYCVEINSEYTAMLAICNNKEGSQVRFIFEESRVKLVTDVNPKKCLQMGDGTGPASIDDNVQLATCDSDVENQELLFDGRYIIHPEGESDDDDRLCLESDTSTILDGASIAASSCSDSADQHWQYDDGIIKAQHAPDDGKRCLERSGANAGAGVIVSPCDDAAESQKWSFENGKVKSGGLCLERASGGVLMEECRDDNEAHVWRLIDGSPIKIPGDGGNCLEASSSKSSVSRDNTCERNAAQLWQVNDGSLLKAPGDEGHCLEASISQNSVSMETCEEKPVPPEQQWWYIR